MTAELRVGYIPIDQVRFHPHNVHRDLGDLRALAESIFRYGIMQPVVVERWGDQVRLRAGHRRVAAARLAGLKKVPALIHAEALDDDEWLLASVHENAQRKNLDKEERVRIVVALRDLGCTWDGIADAFGVGPAAVRSWVTEKDGVATPKAETRRNIKSSTLASFVRYWRQTEWATADDILSALDRVAATAHLVDGMPGPEKARTPPPESWRARGGDPDVCPRCEPALIRSHW